VQLAVPAAFGVGFEPVALDQGSDLGIGHGGARRWSAPAWNKGSARIPWTEAFGDPDRTGVGVVSDPAIETAGAGAIPSYDRDAGLIGSYGELIRLP
jgi:hypothetical protein